jgi:branched-chain amino acid transport system ATP-binding protein
MTSVFSARGVSVSFGGVRAVAGVDLDIEPGQLVGLIGPNGAGKTTFIDAITGFVRCVGDVVLDGVSLNGLPPHARARLGLARTWQTVELFDDLTVRENLTVAARDAAVQDELRLLDLEAVAEAMPWELTQAERKRAGIGRALVARPRLLCLDEPAAGLDARQSRELGRLLPGIAAGGGHRARARGPRRLLQPHRRRALPAQAPRRASSYLGEHARPDAPGAPEIIPDIQAG